MESVGKGPLVGAYCRNGSGRTTVLQKVSEELEATYISLADVFRKIESLHPLQIEEGILQALVEPLSANRVVIFDDLHVFQDIFERCHFSARANILYLALDVVLKILEGGDKTLILGLKNLAPHPFHERCIYVGMPRLSPDDFSHILSSMLGDSANQLDFDRIHRFVPKLSGHQMRYSALHLDAKEDLTTDQFIDLLEKHSLSSNVNTGDVAQASLDDLHGVDDVKRQLDVNVIVPMERVDVAKELGLKAKRGVLLYGAPGTGKTTIGRALAHKLRNKFFLIDGTVINGTQDFYQRILRIFDGAKDNAPSILFIDDCDLLFEDSDETGLYRYLLTMLDGLASEESSDVTVILTAMNIGSLPPALVRSGRIELWLEMKAPSPEARKEILKDQLAKCPEYLQNIEMEPIVTATEGFTGADLKRVVGDALNLYGYDVAKENEISAPHVYMTDAIEQLTANKQRLESAPKFTAAHYGSASGINRGYYAAMAALSRQKQDDE